MSGYRKLLVVVDLSDGSDQVASAARSLAAASNASLVILHVVEFVQFEQVDPLGQPPVLDSLRVEADLVTRARSRLTDLVGRLGLAAAVQRVEVGNIKAEILRVAAEEAVDLIVVGSRERHGLAILMNLTEDTVLHAAHCDVLAVRLR